MTRLDLALQSIYQSTPSWDFWEPLINQLETLYTMNAFGQKKLDQGAITLINLSQLYHLHEEAEQRSILDLIGELMPTIRVAHGEHLKETE